MATKQKKAPAAKKTPAKKKAPADPWADIPSHRVDTAQKDAARAAGQPHLADAPGEGEATGADNPHGHAPCLEF